MYLESFSWKEKGVREAVGKLCVSCLKEKLLSQLWLEAKEVFPGHWAGLGWASLVK